MQDLYAVQKPTEAAELARRLAKLRGQIQPGDAAPVFRSDPPRWPADAAADIKEMVARLWLQQRSKLRGCDHALAVEMVDRRKGVGRDRHIRAVYRSKRRRASAR